MKPIHLAKIQIEADVQTEKINKLMLIGKSILSRITSKTNYVDSGQVAQFIVANHLNFNRFHLRI